MTTIDNILKSIYNIDDTLPPPRDYNVLEIICDDTTGELNALIAENKNHSARLHLTCLEKHPCVFFMN